MRLFKHSCPEFKIKILDYTYTSQPSINSALPLKFNSTKFVFFVIGCLLSSGFLWLLAKWSSKKKAILMYDVCEVYEATDFLIEEEEVIGGSTIVERFNKYDVKRREKAVGFCYHQRTYLYHPEKEVLLPIRYEQLGIQLDKLKKGKYEPHKPKARKRLLDYYGLNEIRLPIQSLVEVFVQEMLTPYEVFQLYAIILWIYQEYYLFSFILLGYSIYTYWGSSKEVVDNQQKLADQSFFDFKCKIATKDYNTFMAISRDDSDQMTVIEEQIRTNRSAEFNDPNFIKLQQEIEPKNSNVLESGSSQHKQQLSEVYGGKTPRSVTADTLEIVEISSRELLPGDLLILKQGDTVPCDCIILSGEALLDEEYISGDNFLVRKSELQNFQYSKEKEKNFILYLGTKIVKVKRNHSFKPDESQMEAAPSELSSQFFTNILESKEVACIVIQTNYNTQRGKYIRAVRYQKKPTQNFTKQTIFFLYILLALTTIVFLILLPIISEGISKFDLFVLYLDLLAISIPMTLPTALSVGISFAQLRLAKSGIHSILPSNIMAGGRATTIVLDAHKIFGKKYEMQSMMVGVKPGRTIGMTYSSLNQFLDLHNTNTLSESYYQDPYKKKLEYQKMHDTGKMLIRAFTACHTLEHYNNELSGLIEQKKIYSFANARYMDEDVHQCLNETITIKQRIFFKEKDKKLAVICQIKQNGVILQQPILQEMKSQSFQLGKEEKNLASSPRQQKKQEYPFKMDEVSLDNQAKAENVHEISLEYKTNQYLFIKGPAEKILPLCIRQSYFEDAQDYVVDMAEKGFKLICFAYKTVEEQFDSEKDIKKLKEDFIFCGFAILEPEKNQETEAAIRQLKRSKMKMVLVSEDRQLQASSMAIHNKFVTKNQLLLCSLRRGKVLCRGHIEWQSSNEQNSITEFLQQSAQFIKNSKVSLNSKLYEELFMKRDDTLGERVLENTIIFNEMQNRHTRNLYFQIQKRDEVSFAVGSGGNVSECAHLSLELERGECSVLSSFHTQTKNLSCITQCLIICRAALATNFHCFSMMVLFSLVQFTTVALLYRDYQVITDDQMLYEDLFVTFPIFITINLTKPVSKLSKELPPGSFFSVRALTSMIGQLLIQFLAQLGFIMYLFSLDSFKLEKQASHLYYLQTGQFAETGVSLATFILTNYLYLGIVLSTSVSKPFRKPFYTNPYYTLTLLALWLFNTAIVLFPEIAPSSIRKQDLSKQVEYILVVAMLLGNLVMILMYLYENLLVWIWDLMKKLGNKNRIGEYTNEHISQH